MTLLELAEACERAESGSRELDAQIAAVVRLDKVPDWARTWAGEWRPNDTGSVVMMQADGTPGPHFMAREYSTSLDAAMQLVPKGLGFMIDGYGTGWYADCSADIDAQAHAKTPALALCAAALRARHALTSP